MKGKRACDFVPLNTGNTNRAFWLYFDLIVPCLGNHFRQMALGERAQNRQWIGGKANQSWLAVAKRQHSRPLELKDFREPWDSQILRHQKREESIGFRTGILPRRETRPVVLEDCPKHIGCQSKHEKPRGEPVNGHDHGSAKFMDQLPHQWDTRVLRQRLFERICRRTPNGHPSKALLPLLDRWAGFGCGCNCRDSGPPHRRRSTAQIPKRVKILELFLNRPYSKSRQEGRENLKNHRLQVRQVRNNVAADFQQRLRYRARVSIQPESVQLKTPGEMDLPNTLQRNLGEELFDGLAAVALIAVDVVQVEPEYRSRRTPPVRLRIRHRGSHRCEASGNSLPSR